MTLKSPCFKSVPLFKMQKKRYARDAHGEIFIFLTPGMFWLMLKPLSLM